MEEKIEEVTPKINIKKVKKISGKTTVRVNNYQNPFDVPDSAEIFSKEENEKKKKKLQIKNYQKMSLAERALLGSEQMRDPRSMQLGTSRNLKNSDEKTPDIKPVSEIRQRQQRANQIIEEQREMFFSNLLISRHQKELDRLQIQKKAQEAKLITMDLEAREAQNRSKTTNNQYMNRLLH